ncbi:MAG: response regulator [Alphaproteobacteria bacterium]|nr:response regulator [Alphaproteobacteria bacterium]
MTMLRILIVDDDVDFADGLMEVCELEGHEPVMVHKCTDGVAAFERLKFDVALIDIGLPDVNGGECLRAIRAIRPDLPCFLLTGYSAEDIADKGIEADSAEILTKPIDPEALIRLLAAI